MQRQTETYYKMQSAFLGALHVHAFRPAKTRVALTLLKIPLIKFSISFPIPRRKSSLFITNPRHTVTDFHNLFYF